jgi:DNA-binding winged helix-turn-helix (wHTH) protein
MHYRFGDYVLDTQRHELHHAGLPIKLRRKVFQVLVYLLVHRDRVVSKQELLAQLWPDQFVGEAALTSCIQALRRALGERGRTPRYLRTLHSQGYRFVGAVEAREHLPVDDVLHVFPPTAERGPSGRPRGHRLPCPQCSRTWGAPPGRRWTGNTNRSPCSVGPWPMRRRWPRAWGRRRCTI